MGDQLRFVEELLLGLLVAAVLPLALLPAGDACHCAIFVSASKFEEILVGMMKLSNFVGLVDHAIRDSSVLSKFMVTKSESSDSLATSSDHVMIIAPPLVFPFYAFQSLAFLPITLAGNLCAGGGKPRLGEQNTLTRPAKQPDTHPVNTFSLSTVPMV